VAATNQNAVVRAVTLTTVQFDACCTRMRQVNCVVKAPHLTKLIHDVEADFASIIGYHGNEPCAIEKKRMHDLSSFFIVLATLKLW